MSHLQYYVELEPGNPAYRQYIKTKKPHYATRSEFVRNEGLLITVNGVAFPAEKVMAEPKKHSTWIEAIVAMLITWAALYYVPGPDFHFSPARWIVAIFLSFCFGRLLGKFIISLHQEDANKFNAEKW